MLVRWLFIDPANSETYEMEINPNQGGTPHRKRNVDSVATLAPDGKPIVFEGAESPAEISWSGIIRSQDHFNALQNWYEKHHQIEVVDDLGRSMWIYITSFKPQRKRDWHATFKHTYDLTAIVLDWDSEP